MADRQWYTGRDGKQEGPYSDARIRELIASGAVQTPINLGSGSNSLTLGGGDRKSVV